MIPGPKHRRLLTVGAETLARSIRGAERRGGGAWGGVSPPHDRRWRGSRSDARHHSVGVNSLWQNPGGPVLPVGARPAIHSGQTAGSETHAAQFSRWGLGRRSIPAEPRRSAPLIVAFRSKYTRASSPGGGSSLTRLVSRAPLRARRSPGFHHRLLAPRIRRMQGAGVLFRRVARCRGACPSGRFPSRRGLNAEIWRRGAPPGRGVGRGFPSPQERVGRIAKRFSTPPRGVSAPHPKNAGSRCAFSPGGAMPGCLPLGEIPLPARTQCRDLAARSAAGEGCGEGFPLPTGKGGENREAILDAAPRG